MRPCAPALRATPGAASASLPEAPSNQTATTTRTEAA
ncbi:hypothetical protein SAMN05428939_1382 [Streptomyces sp. TLI_105]|nr:hypothetical protein SAMN05428939_1382 [Streptomyces sp. TLI_105]